MIIIGCIALLAAIVNGALGYGFSSIAVPLALLTVSNRELNPAIVLVEIVLNAWLVWHDRAAVPIVWRRITTIALALPVGVYLGTTILVHADPTWLRFATFLALLPLILLQAAGIRRTIRAERAASAALGGGVGLLYSVTTISGPPLALFFNNQGLNKSEFRASLGLIKLVVCSLTLIAYLRGGLIVASSVQWLYVMLPAVIVGLPLGAWIIKRVEQESFRRVCMCFDAAIVAFGISALLQQLHLVEGHWAWTPLAVVLTYDVIVLWRHQRARRSNESVRTSTGTPTGPTPLPGMVS